MRQTSTEKMLFAKDGKLVRISTGVDYCAEHEGSSVGIFRYFGCKPPLHTALLCSGAFSAEDFSVKLEDHLVSKKDCAVLIKLAVPTAKSKLVERYMPKAISDEVDAAKAALAAKKKSFRVGKTLPAFVVVSKNLLEGSWSLRARVIQEAEKLSLTLEKGALDIDEKGVMTITCPQLSMLVLAQLDFVGSVVPEIRRVHLLRHAQANGVEVPQLEKSVLPYNCLHYEEQAARRGVTLTEDGPQLVKGLYAASWSTRDYFRAENAVAEVEWALVSADPLVMPYLEQLVASLQAGTALFGMSVPNNPFARSSGLTFQPVGTVSLEEKALVEDQKVAFRDRFMALKASLMYENFAKKVAEVQSERRLKLEGFNQDTVYVSNFPKGSGRSNSFKGIPLEEVQQLARRQPQQRGLFR